MAEKIKQNISLLFCAALGFLNLIFLALPYMSFFGIGFSGYSVIGDWWGEGFAGFMCSMLQLLELIGGIGMLVIGILGIIQIFGNNSQLKQFNIKKLAKMALIAMTVINVLLLLFLIILVSDLGIDLSAGIFVTLVFTVASLVVSMVVENKFVSSEAQNARQD